MKDKYVDERFGRYVVVSAERDGRVEVDKEPNGQVVALVSRVEAEGLVRDRDELMDFITALANAFEVADRDAFLRFWYTDSAREEPHCHADQ